MFTSQPNNRQFDRPKMEKMGFSREKCMQLNEPVIVRLVGTTSHAQKIGGNAA